MLKPLIPQSLTWVALSLGAALFGAGQFVPAPYSAGCAILGSVALYLGGKGWRTPQWAVGKPLLPAALVPMALSVVQMLNAFGGSLPPSLQPYVVPVTGLLSLLAGVVEPEPLKVTGGAPDATGNLPSGPAAAPVDPTCSIYDRIRGLC
ncbi:hypothetical protein [Myxococcus landrumensis]|uniref:Uncharacterized protein n=1 Tax=Myxococcus landrumensis TaxID=2813577 RepID=A0ABX7N5X3_9BACT|nr:hypothetical protein [Myxococcus landrumus]QSQ14028.1 hypothetical protein JY572_37900 [Myxococcus landrumus]